MTNKGYYNDRIMAKFRDAFNAACAAIDSGEDIRVRISNANSKMGNVASVSTLPFLTCPACCGDTCGEKCYAAKLANLRPAALKSYAVNTAIAIRRPDVYWTQVNAAISGVRFFRFHVSGDIMNADYFAHMIECARNNPHTEILCFTKRYNIVNQWIDVNGEIPANMHILFSGWTNLTPDNPYMIPETNVIPHGEIAKDNWSMCNGNCFECAITGNGCWAAKHGDVIAFNMH